VKESEALIGVVGMRVDTRTRAFDELQRYLETLGLPVLGYIRNTQNYVYLAARGLTLFDVAPGRVQQDLEQWAPILKWLGG
jgi:chromosome partitioning protein